MLFSASFVCSNDCTDYRVVYIQWCSGEWSISLWLVEWEKLLVQVSWRLSMSRKSFEDGDGIWGS